MTRRDIELEVAQLEAEMRRLTVEQTTKKILTNGTFGKLGSKYSFLFAPNLMIQVTITGQLALLMLIEELELAGISVVSANTDGIVSKFTVDQEETYHQIVKDWEARTGFEMEFADYKALYSASVNSYLAVKTDGSVKQKGLYAFVGSKGSPAEKNPKNYVCVDAVINYLTKGVPFEETIEWCPDIRRFLSVQKVTGGANFRGEYVGAKAVRWYHSRNSSDAIHYVENGNKVPKSDGAMPLMELTGHLPDDIDYDYYIAESRKMLGELGVL
jgi:DNA polymerase elongation subunit (family B)